jgi:hypothetical protein
MKPILFSVLILALSACGGGGGSTSGPAPTPIPPPDTDSRSLLLPPGSEAAFVAEIKSGLEQWAGVSGDADLIDQILRLDVVVPVQTDALMTAVAAPKSARAFTQTNVLVAGVDEIDHVRYDGELMYIANQDRIQIVRPDAAGSVPVSTLRVPGNDFSWSEGLYLYQSGAASLLANVRSNAGTYWYANWFAPWSWSGKTRIDIVNTDTAATPRLSSQLVIDGNYVNSRRVGKTLYLVTRFTPVVKDLIANPNTAADRDANRTRIARIAIRDVLPRLTFADGTSRPLVTTAECFVPNRKSGDTIRYPTITTVTAIDLTAPSNFASLCMPEGVYGMHVSRNAIYLAAYQSAANARFYDETIIHKLGIQGGAPTYEGSGRVPGTFWGDPAFLMGERAGNLTAVTTVRDAIGGTSHRLTILRQSANPFELEVAGQIPNPQRTAAIGKPGEQIYASRITGNRAFIVTFAQIDPVYIVDLTDPTDPFVAGELEIPGFSSYLHPVTDNLLLGVGKDAVTEEGTTWFQGVNLRLFDVSSAADIKLLANYSFGKRGTDTAVLWDAHAFTIQDLGDTARITIPMRIAGEHVAATGYPGTYYPWTETALYLFDLNEIDQSLQPAGKVVAEDASSGERFQPGCCAWSDRSFIHGDTVAYLSKSRLITTTWNAPTVKTSLFLPTVFGNAEDTTSTTESRNGLVVWLLDRTTGNSVRCGTARAIDGDFSALLATGCSGEEDRGLFERAGSYAVEVDVPGYRPWRGEDVRVQGNQFHVDTTFLNVYLTPE